MQNDAQISPKNTSTEQEKQIRQQESDYIQLYRINAQEDELISLDHSIKRLKSEQSYILIDETARNIFIWVGSATSVQQRFVAARSANKIHRDKGMTFRVKTMDQGFENQEFMETLNEFQNSS